MILDDWRWWVNLQAGILLLLELKSSLCYSTNTKSSVIRRVQESLRSQAKVRPDECKRCWPDGSASERRQYDECLVICAFERRAERHQQQQRQHGRREPPLCVCGEELSCRLISAAPTNGKRPNSYSRLDKAEGEKRQCDKTNAF